MSYQPVPSTVRVYDAGSSFGIASSSSSPVSGVGGEEDVGPQAQGGQRAAVLEGADGPEPRADHLLEAHPGVAVLAVQVVAEQLVAVGQHVHPVAVHPDRDLAGAGPVLAEDPGVVLARHEPALGVAPVDLHDLPQLGARQREPVAGDPGRPPGGAGQPARRRVGVGDVARLVAQGVGPALLGGRPAVLVVEGRRDPARSHPGHLGETGERGRARGRARRDRARRDSSRRAEDGERRGPGSEGAERGPHRPDLQGLRVGAHDDARVATVYPVRRKQNPQVPVDHAPAPGGRAQRGASHIGGSRALCHTGRRTSDSSRALGSVKTRTGGNSPRPGDSQSPVDQVELLDRRSKSGWEDARGSMPLGPP